MALLRSIWNDLLYTLRVSNIVTRLMVVNFAVFLIANLALGLMLLTMGPVSGGEAFDTGLHWFCVPASPYRLLFQVWSPITYMFLHLSLLHLIGNLIFMHLFGTVISDLIGPRRVLPIYLLGGVVGALAFMVSAYVLPSVGEYALGASGAVMALAGAALLLAPDYRIRLLLLGDVKLKYIVLVLLIFDLIGIAGQYNSGGHAAHLGGFVLGISFIHAMRQGSDWAEPVNRLLDHLSKLLRRQSERRRRAAERSLTVVRGGRAPVDELSFQERLDAILDKIKASGLESLTPEEREFLYHASKK
ncbi:MAG: rhomboid family intramembrane serine protease [Saprospiraceae bacterium]|nr:rhomboid family intramembrane serine protease [Saprospiraceae bacterium]MDW8229706.1 rhomboid family intramembrane serine protease [Saprospiraceae bacterium]